MYGLIGKITAQEGQRDALAAILKAGTQQMPGCQSYLIALDSTSEDIIWITEVWDNAEAHQASLQLPDVQDAIAKGRPMIAGMERIAELTPIT